MPKPPLPRVTPLPKLYLQDRVTITQNMHHEHFGTPPVSIPPSIHSRMLEHVEEPYQRRLRAGKDWQPVVDDGCWIPANKIGYVTIENLEGKVQLVNPTEDERKKTASKILELSYTKNSKEADLVYPGATQIKVPADASKLYVRCQDGEGSYKLHVFSK